jgi:hypothetical protein
VDFPLRAIFFVPFFVTVAIPVFGGSARHYLREASAAQVPEKIVTRDSLKLDKRKTQMEM